MLSDTQYIRTECVCKEKYNKGQRWLGTRHSQHELPRDCSNLTPLQLQLNFQYAHCVESPKTPSSHQSQLHPGSKHDQAHTVYIEDGHTQDYFFKFRNSYSTYSIEKIQKFKKSGDTEKFAPKERTRQIPRKRAKKWR